MSRSLRGRLTLGLLLGTGLLFAVAGVVADRVVTRRLEREFDDTLLTRAQSLQSLTEDSGGRLWLELAEHTMPEFESRREPDYFELWLAGGPAITRSRSLGESHLEHLEPETAGPALRNVRLPDGRRGRQVEVAFHPRREIYEGVEGEDVAPSSELEAVLAVALGREDLDLLLAELRTSIVLMVAGLLAATVLLVTLMTRVALAPLDALARRLSMMGADSLGRPIGSAGMPSELQPVVDHLDALLGRIEASFARERAFSANLAHELRTPLSELRAVTDVGLRWSNEGELALESLAEARSIGLQMELLVGNLLALARYDGKQQTVARAPVRLRDLVTECWRGVAAEAESRSVALELEVAPELTVVNDREQLGLLVSNLVANAVAHGRRGSPVLVEAHAGVGEVVLDVVNRVDDLVEADLPHLFERFWRKDAARSGSRHVGLGLALVAALGELLEIEPEARLNGDSFTMRLRMKELAGRSLDGRSSVKTPGVAEPQQRGVLVVVADGAEELHLRSDVKAQT